MVVNYVAGSLCQSILDLKTRLQAPCSSLTYLQYVRVHTGMISVLLAEGVSNPP